jgi:ribosome-binding factor A
MSQRTDRVDELLRQEIGALLAKELADPRIGFTTITDVETSPDLRHAKVWVSVIGGRSDRTETIRALQASMGFVRHELGKRLRIKRIPALHVQLDDSAERGTRLLHLLGELEQGVDPLDVTPFNESLPTPVKRLPHEGDAPEPAADADVDVDVDTDADVQAVLEAGLMIPPASKARPSRHAKGRGQGVDRVARGAPRAGGPTPGGLKPGGAHHGGGGPKHGGAKRDSGRRPGTGRG